MAWHLAGTKPLSEPMLDIVNWTLENKLQWNLIRNLYIFIHENVFQTRWVDGNWSHPGHYLVNPYTWPWSPNGHGHGHKWPSATPFVQCQSALPFWDTAISKLYYENPWSRSCVWSKVKVTLNLQNSKIMVMVMVKPIGHIWGLEFNWFDMFAFHFVAIGPLLAEI